MPRCVRTEAPPSYEPMRCPVDKLRFGVLLGFAHLAVAGTIPPIWTSPSGTLITSWDSVNSGVGLKTIDFPLNFVFPLFGQEYTSATISSNGSLYFDSEPNSSQPQADVPELLQGLPRIAPAWYDTNAISGSGSILVQLLSGQLIFTWENISSYAPPAGQAVPASDLATFQLTLNSNGNIIFGYQAFNSVNPASTGVVNSLVGSQEAIVGVTDGYGASDPGSADLSALAIFQGFSQTTASNTVYQLVNNNPPDNSNFAGLNLIFTPESQNGWQVTSEYSKSGNTGVDPTTPEPATDVEMILAALALAAFCWHRASRAKRCCGDSR